MDRYEAKNLAQTATPEQIEEMFRRAQSKIKDWHRRSRVNKGMTIGATFNLMTKFNYRRDNVSVLAKTNAIWDFGEYFPGGEELKGKTKDLPEPYHEEPKFLPDLQPDRLDDEADKQAGGK